MVTEWSASMDASLFHALVDGVNAVSRDCWLTPSCTGFECDVLNLSNTVYGHITLATHVTHAGTGTGKFERIGINAGKMSQTITGSGPITIEHGDNTLTVKAGRSRFRFVDYAPSIMREYKDLTHMKSGTVCTVPCKDLYQAVMQVDKFCTCDTVGAHVKVYVEFNKDELVVRDRDKNIEISIQVDAMNKQVQDTIVLSSAYLQQLAQYMKQVYEHVNVCASVPDKPVIFDCSNNESGCMFVVAPVMDM